MKKHLLTSVLFLILGMQLFAQNNLDSATLANINTLYKLAVKYKDGNGVTMDYNKAYAYFTQAAALGDPQSVFAMGYMQYKGLGIPQNYDSAASLFAKGVQLNKDNSLYFLGLCWRNGYGLPKNEDSAKFYLTKSADLGYKQAKMELQMPIPENSNDSAANALLQQLNNAAIPSRNVLNQYNKIQPYLPTANIIAGEYNGWLLQYDWSGTHIVMNKNLQLNIEADAQNISGQWIEDEADTAMLKGSIQSDSILFNNTKYQRKDHYATVKPVTYNFQNAKLNLVQTADSVFIAGNIEMYSPVRGEPSKPMFVVLSRKRAPDSILNALKLIAFPNPSSNVLNAVFNLPSASKVEIQVYNLNGTIIYHNNAGLLEAGSYSLPIPVQNMSSGTYILNLIYGKQTKSVKVVKQ